MEDLRLVDLEQLAMSDPIASKTKPGMSINVNTLPALKQEGHCKTKIKNTGKGGVIAAARQWTSHPPPG
jgi:hypothetical protein